MKDELLEQILALIEDPIPLLNSPEDERFAMECALFDLAELLEDYRCGVLSNGKENEG